MLSLADFAARKGLSRIGRRGSEMHVRMQQGDFNHRPLTEWERIFAEYERVDRTPRSSHP